MKRINVGEPENCEKDNMRYKDYVKECRNRITGAELTND